LLKRKENILIKTITDYFRNRFNLNPILLSKLDEIIKSIDKINEKELKTQNDIKKLTEKMQENKNIMASAVILIAKLAEQIVINKNSPEAIQALADELEKSSKLLAQAITDNTPSDKTPEDLQRES
jgi:hypothetical protein